MGQNYFNTLPLRLQLHELGKCRFMDRSEFTDDASVFQAAGHHVELCEGDPWNVKVTTPEDLTIAEAFVRSAWPQG